MTSAKDAWILAPSSFPLSTMIHQKKIRPFLCLLWLHAVFRTATCLCPSLKVEKLSQKSYQTHLTMATSSDDLEARGSGAPMSMNRRRYWQIISAAAAASLLSFPVHAEETTAVLPEMKSFVDQFFVIKVPKNFFTIRRSAKGDLPDAKTGQGRRGSSIFTAGDMSKAEVVAVERYPTRVLLEENGIEATGDLSTFPNLGEPTAIANLISVRRDRDRPGQGSTKLIPGSVSVSSDGKILNFQLRTEIEVQKPELLMEQFGVSELFRITSAKASLESSDGNLMAVFASALEQDYKGSDGVALQETVDSFVALDQSQKS